MLTYEKHNLETLNVIISKPGFLKKPKFSKSIDRVRFKILQKIFYDYEQSINEEF